MPFYSLGNWTCFRGRVTRANGKAGRFIQTAMREWAYARPYETSDQRVADFPAWIHMHD